MSFLDVAPLDGSLLSRPRGRFEVETASLNQACAGSAQWGITEVEGCIDNPSSKRSADASDPKVTVTASARVAASR